jgi:hypothetical protein
VKLNGNLTLGENTADNGGLRIAFMALEKHSFRRKPRRDRSGWIFPGAKILHSLRRVLVLECDAPIPTHAGADRSSFNAASARERSGIQHAGVSESLRLQEGAAHGEGERLSRLVGAEPPPGVTGSETEEDLF